MKGDELLSNQSNLLSSAALHHIGSLRGPLVGSLTSQAFKPAVIRFRPWPPSLSTARQDIAKVVACTRRYIATQNSPRKIGSSNLATACHSESVNLKNVFQIHALTSHY